MTRLGRFFSRILKPSSAWSGAAIFLILAALLVLGYLGYLEPVRAILDNENLAVAVGDTVITPYRLLKAILVVVVLIWTASLVTGIVDSRVQRLEAVKAANRQLLSKIFQIAIYFAVFLVGLDALGIDLTAFAVLGGAVGIGLGFGLQKITSNFISGLILVFEKTLKVGDLIELPDGTLGFVRHLGARHTLVETFDTKEIMVPNEDFITSRVTNWTYSSPKGRVEIPIGVSYGSDLELVERCILEAATAHPRCSKDPAPQCYLREFGDSSVNFLLYFWIDDVTQGRYRPQSDVMFAIWRSFKEHGIEIPFPQRDVHVKSGDVATS